MVQVTIRATSPNELELIASYLHDRRFDLEEVTFDDARGELHVPFLKGQGRRTYGRIRRRLTGRPEAAPEVPGKLTVGRVVNYSIDDRAGIQCFDFDWIFYDEQIRRLLIRSHFPLEILITVEDLDVSLILE